jgi:hypothetical protein
LGGILPAGGEKSFGTGTLSGSLGGFASVELMHSRAAATVSGRSIAGMPNGAIFIGTATAIWAVRLPDANHEG